MLNGNHPNKALNGVHSNGYADKSGEGGRFNLDPTKHADRKLIRRAVERGWPVKRGTRRKCCKALHDAIERVDPETQAKIATVLVRMDETNLRRDEFEDKQRRLDAGESTENVGITGLLMGRVRASDAAPSIAERVARGELPG